MFWVLLGIAAAGAATADGAGAQPSPADAHQRCVRRVEEALSRRPDDARLLLVLGDVHERGGRLQDAQAAFDKAMSISPRLPLAVLRAAQTRARLGQGEAAVPLFRAAMAEGDRPLRIAAAAGLADVLYQANRFGEAASVLRQAIADGDRGAEALFMLGKALDREAAALASDQDQKKQALEKEALAALADALRIDPGHAPARYVLGMLLQRQGNNVEARKELEAFRKAKSARTAVDLAGARRREESAELRTALDLARAHLEAGRIADAEPAAAEALRLSPRDLEARLFQAQLLARAERWQEAARAYQGILQEQPAQPEALWSLGRLQIREGRKDEGAALCLRAAEARRYYPEAYELLASLALQDGVLAGRAEEFARRALEQRPSPGNFVRLAVVLHGAGKDAECERVIREGLARYPGNADLLQGIQILGKKAPGQP